MGQIQTFPSRIEAERVRAMLVYEWPDAYVSELEVAAIVRFDHGPVVPDNLLADCIYSSAYVIVLKNASRDGVQHCLGCFEWTPDFSDINPEHLRG